jgi:tetratricopeptide (TPR) repeat protein
MPDAPIGPTRELISPALFERFRDRIAADLATRPFTMPAQEHRQAVAGMLETVGGATAYDVLGLSVGSRPDEVQPAYTRLARQVHPAHAAALELPEAILRLLFEHATRAYLVLSDPDRRKAYDREHRGEEGSGPRAAAELDAARREMAAKNFQRAQGLMRSEQYHYVVELLRDTVRWDRRPEAIALLGEAQARNPNWLGEAIENLREAVTLAPREVAYRLRLAQVLEEAGRGIEARTEYEGVLTRFPSHPEALSGLERLRAAGTPARRT